MRRQRRPKDRGRFRRDTGRRPPRGRILIVTEGALTEPTYLGELLDHLRVNRANIDIAPSPEPQPGGVLRFAREKFEQEGGANEYAAVFCVFDRDAHGSYQPAIDEIKRLSGKIFADIPSAPCFEYWLLLHFEKTTKPYSAAAKSACEQAEDDLRRHMPEYRKNMPGAKHRVFMRRLETALSNSRETFRQAVRGENFPSTRMHVLVERLRKMAVND